MLLDVSATVNPVDMARFNATLAEMTRHGKRTATDTLFYAAIDFCLSARKRTKLSQTRRTVRVNTDPLTGRVAPWLIEAWHQGSRTPDLWPASSKSDSRRVIMRRGAARNSWSGAMRALNYSRGGSTVGSAGINAGWARKHNWQSEKPSVIVQNRIQYLDAIAPNLVSESLGAVTRAMERRLSRAAAKMVGL